MGNRRYTEREMAEIIRKAAEIQSGQANPSDSQGISEDEIRHAAMELGIAPGALDAALRGAAESGPQQFNWWGGPTRYEAERIFDGTISDEAWEDILADLRQTFEENGTVERRGATYEWAATGGGVDYKTITLRPTGDSTRLKATSSFGGSAAVWYAAMPIPMFVVVGLLAKVGWPVSAEWLVGLSAFAASWMGARHLTTLAVRKRFRRFADLFDRIQTRIEGPDEGVRPQLVNSSSAVQADNEEQPLTGMP